MTVATVATVAVMLLLVGVASQVRRWSDEDRAADPTVAPPARASSPASSPATEPAGRTPEASPNPTSNPPRQTDPPATPTALVPPGARPAAGGAAPAEPAPRGGTATAPVPSPSTQAPPNQAPPNQAPTTTVTYRFPPGTPSPQFRDGTCVYRIWYGNYGDTPFAKVRFYSGDCGSVAVAVVGQHGTTTSYYGTTGTSTGTDSCGTYIEVQADGRGARATAVGETLYFPETGHGYEFMSGAGQPPAALRSC